MFELIMMELIEPFRWPIFAAVLLLIESLLKVRTATNLARRQQPQEPDIVRTTTNLPRRQQRNNRHNFITTS